MAESDLSRSKGSAHRIADPAILRSPHASDGPIRLDPNEIISPLGAGGMGEVRKAAPRARRTVAAMVLSTRSDVHLRERFDREARANAQLRRGSRPSTTKPAAATANHPDQR
jgi:hypothetical protein